jgi:nicotinamidase-related amidase
LYYEIKLYYVYFKYVIYEEGISMEEAGKKTEIVEKKVLRLNLRTRVETFKGSGVWGEVTIQKEFPVAETAILICDMWNKHWCRGATERVTAMAPKMNSVIKAARRNGVQIIHSPSDTLDYYATTPYRQRMINAPYASPPKPLDLSTSPPLPIDDSDGGCDTGEKPSYKAWTRQNPAIEITDPDGISDNGQEVYNFMQQRGIKNLIIMGVHTNMCVLGRSFGIKQMTKWKVHCVLVRDLTDAMYNPQRPPFVSHEEGTKLVVEYIEKYWCPSILSDDLFKAYPSPPSLRDVSYRNKYAHKEIPRTKIFE